MIYRISILPRWESVDQKIGRKEFENFTNNIILELVYNSLGGSAFEHKIGVLFTCLVFTQLQRLAIQLVIVCFTDIFLKSEMRLVIESKNVYLYGEE